MDITKFLIKKFLKITYKPIRRYYLNDVILKIGKIKETDSEITCYVTQDLLEKNGKNVFYELDCNGMIITDELSRKIVNYYKLNKPVYYIFDGIVFDNPVTLSALTSHVIFRNCTFNNGLRIVFAEDVTLENNKYINWMDDFCGKPFLYGGVMGSLTIKDDNFVNSYELQKYCEKHTLGMDVTTDKLKIINSKICAESDGQINIKTKELELVDSVIESPEIYLDSDSIVSSKSLLKAEKGIIIENKNCDCNTEVDFNYTGFPYVLYNGMEMVNKSEVLKVNQRDAELQDKRRRFLQVLKNIKSMCDEINYREIVELETHLEQQNIEKVLKR